MVDFRAILINLYNLLHSITFSVGETTISIISILQVIICLLLVLVLTHYFNELLKKRILNKIIFEKGVRNIVSNIVSYGIGTLLFIIVLQSTGFNISILTFVGGGLGIGIGLGLQDLTKNFVSGLTLLFERKIKIGNFVKLDNFEGVIAEISIRTVILKLRDGSSVIVPSNYLVENQIINYDYETEVIRLSLLVGVAYGTDPVLVTETLLCAAYHDNYVLKEPPAQVIFKDFGDNALHFELRVWIKTENIGLKYDILGYLRFLIEYHFRLNQITIPFPQQDLWIRNVDATAKYIPTSNQPIAPKETQIPEIANNIKKPPSIRNILKSVSYFQNLNEIEIRQMIEIGQLQKLVAEEILFREDDQGDAFYIILTGAVEIVAEKLGKTLAVLEEGSFFGELALMLGIPRTATVKAQKETLLFAIKSRNFKKLLQNNPNFSEAIFQDLAKHQEELTQRKQELSDKGLLTPEEDDSNIVIWARKRLKLLFSF